ncbi:acid protease [Punctularia strigosozonata HHB-11173 SS5]|uniref:acid protease n=1 Tax=Punctularia strigosozonata (strain HHB-11173) TaxID=741275 RepID=UPI0004417B36|nr:acid protease [Punctularia strigosozonata HHB-11173 SS5]EIN12712.1 acid protease [Punctularia strigosozonata HHB-11173 SS5]
MDAIMRPYCIHFITPSTALNHPKILVQSLQRAGARALNKLCAAKAVSKREQDSSTHVVTDVVLEPPIVSHQVGPQGSTQVMDFWTNEDLLYIINVQVGTPPRTFMVQADTGSADFWLATPGSVGVPATFDPSTSSTYHDLGRSINLTYGDGSQISPEVRTDVVTVAGFTLENVVVEPGLISPKNAHGLGFEGISGLMGFAWSSLARSGLPGFVEQLANTTALEENIFSCYFARGLDALDYQTVVGNTNGTVNVGSLTIGGVDNTTFSGDITYYPIVAENIWSVHAEGLSVDSNSCRALQISKLW